MTHKVQRPNVSETITLLRPYFNQQFYIMLYVYVIVCGFGAHNISQRFDKTSKWRRVDTDGDGQVCRLGV